MTSKNKLEENAKKNTEKMWQSVNMLFSQTAPEPTAKESRKPYTDEQMDEALKAAYRNGRQQDGADLLGINKGTFSKNKREIEENEPERVERLKAEIEAEKAIEQDTPQAPQEPQTAPEPNKAEDGAPIEENPENKANTKRKKQVFSFRAMVDDIANWKAYATATGVTMENVGTAAMNEYLKRHKLTGAEQAIFEGIKAKNEK